MLARAKAVGVTRVVTVGETLADAERIWELAGVHPEILPAAGLYPTYLDMDQADAVIAFIRAHSPLPAHGSVRSSDLTGRTLVAIGEVGLDHWKVQDDAGRAVQREIFARFIDLSLELDLPLNVHSRSAGRAVIELLLERGAKRVLLHAFDGRAATAMPAVEAGYFFSIPPSIARSEQKQKLVKRLPLSCILLETDSPVLGPERGARNEPANIVIALQAVAAIKGVTEDEVREAVDENQERLLRTVNDFCKSTT